MKATTTATAFALTFSASAGFAQEAFEVNNVYRMNKES